MTTINRSDITEESVWQWTCPECNFVTQEQSESFVKDYATCDDCFTNFEIIEDAK